MTTDPLLMTPVLTYRSQHTWHDPIRNISVKEPLLKTRMELARPFPISSHFRVSSPYPNPHRTWPSPPEPRLINLTAHARPTPLGTSVPACSPDLGTFAPYSPRLPSCLIELKSALADP